MKREFGKHTIFNSLWEGTITSVIRLKARNCQSSGKKKLQHSITCGLIKTVYLQGGEHETSYGKQFSPKDSGPDVLRLKGAIRTGQGSVVGLIKFDCDPAPSTY